jgi:ornithine carbamoyltransferase
MALQPGVPEPTTTTATPVVGMAARHFLTLGPVGPAGLRALLDLAQRAKRDPGAFAGALAGGKVGMLFDKPSTRTRISLEGAAWALGMLPVVLRPDELQVGRGETIADTARVLSRYLDAVTIRTFEQQRVEELAANATIPIVNALTDEHHPCQALADLMTLEEAFGSLAGLTLAYVGDGDNVCHSLIEGAALGGFRLRIGCPAEYEPDDAILAAAREVARTTGGAIELTHDPQAAVDGADAVYTDVWASMGRDAEHDARAQIFAPYRVDEALMGRTAKHAIFLHCLPAHRGEEVVDAVIDGPRSRVWDQAENRLHTSLALLYALIADDLGGTRLTGDGRPIAGWMPVPGGSRSPVSRPARAARGR